MIQELPFFSLWANRNLIRRLTKRAIHDRYQGSLLGVFWSLLNPMIMIAVYTFVFSIVFKAKWSTDGGSGQDSNMHFAVILFCGLIVHSFFSEVLIKSPNLITTNVSYVKKIVFPIEVIVVVTICESIFYALINFAVLMVVLILVSDDPFKMQILFAPVVFLPLIILSLGVGWILSSLGVFIRDINQTTGILSSMLLFMSPVFFPLSALPKNFQTLVKCNPLTFIIEQLRAVVIFGNSPDWLGLTVYTGVAIGVLIIGFSCFQLTRKGFADVL